MNSTMRNLTLTAAALAALTVIAPKAAAEGPWSRFPLPPSPHEMREMWNERHGGGHDRDDHGRGYGRDGRRHSDYGHGYGYRYAAPRPVYRYGYGPYRVYAGTRFFTACPGPGYVYVAGFGWAFPPFFGAVWVPGHWDFRGLWIEGHWR